MWHLLNFFTPALGVGLIVSTLTKLLWRRELKGISWMRLVGWCSALCSAALLAGLVCFGHDGKIATYLGLVAISALTLWFLCFGPLRR
jgi:hypothetical protein